MKTNTIALIIQSQTDPLQLIDTLSHPREIDFFESALTSGEVDPLQMIYDYRVKESKQDEEFGNYIEELLSRPFLKPDVQRHAVQWLKSKIKIEHYQKIERDAAKTISDFAYKIFQKDPTKTDFFLTSKTSQVRVRVFEVRSN